MDKEQKCCAAILGLTLFGIGFMSYANSIVITYGFAHNRLYQQASVKADVDRIDGTTNKEWAQVYTQLRKHYDEATSKPKRDLSNTDLKKYLEME